MPNAIILSCGAYAPDSVIPNSYFDASLGEDVSTWLEENVHIFERRWASENQSAADLAMEAAQQALERANLRADAIDLIIVSTDTPEYISPSTASVVQHRLGAEKAGSFDINTACAGFVTALDMAAKYIKADEQYQHILVIGTYVMSKYLNLKDKKTVTLFADGAGAMILHSSKEEKRGFQASQLLSKGEYHDWMGIYAGGTRQPINQDVLASHEHQLQFVKKFPRELNPQIWTEMALDLCQKLNVRPNEVNQYLITQININAIWATLERLGVEREKAHTIMHQYGYTGSACIPMAFNDAWEKGRVKSDDLVFFIGSGGGLSFASAAFYL